MIIQTFQKKIIGEKNSFNKRNEKPESDKRIQENNEDPQTIPKNLSNFSKFQNEINEIQTNHEESRTESTKKSHLNPLSQNINNYDKPLVSNFSQPSTFQQHNFEKPNENFYGGTESKPPLQLKSQSSNGNDASLIHENTVGKMFESFHPNTMNNNQPINQSNNNQNIHKSTLVKSFDNNQSFNPNTSQYNTNDIPNTYNYNKNTDQNNHNFNNSQIKKYQTETLFYKDDKIMVVNNYNSEQNEHLNNNINNSFSNNPQNKKNSFQSIGNTPSSKNLSQSGLFNSPSNQNPSQNNIIPPSNKYKHSDSYNISIIKK